MSIDVPSVVRAAVIVAINGYKLNHNIFGGQSGFDKFFSKFETDVYLKESLGENVIKDVKPIVYAFVKNYQAWVEVFAGQANENVMSHLFAALTMNTLNMGQLLVTASARPSDVLCDYLPIAVDDGVSYDDVKYRDLVTLMLTDMTAPRRDDGRHQRATHTLNEAWERSADLFIAAVKVICGITSVVTSVSELIDNTVLAAEKVKAFYTGAAPTR